VAVSNVGSLIRSIFEEEWNATCPGIWGERFGFRSRIVLMVVEDVQGARVGAVVVLGGLGFRVHGGEEGGKIRWKTFRV